MAQTKAAVRSRAAAARSEVNGKGREIVLSHKLLKGMKLHGPAELPATYSLDYAEVLGFSRARDQRVMGSIFALVTSVFGDEGWGQIRDKVAGQTGPDDDLLASILRDIDEGYGTDAGES